MVEHHRGRRVAGGIALAALIFGVSLTPRVAIATTQTKFYNAAATWSTVPAFVGVTDTASITLGNDPTSTQSFGSAELTFNTQPSSAVQVVQSSVPAGWAAKVLNGTPAVVLLTSQNAAAVLPGGSLTVQVKVTATAAGTLVVGTQVKQSNNFSGTGNDFVRLNSSGLTISVIALSLQFTQQPSVQIGQSLPAAVPPYFTSFCNPVSVQIYNGAAPVAASGIPVTIKYAGSSNPGLYFQGAAVTASGVTVNTDSSGLATFGSCASGLGASVVGLGFTLSAGAPGATAVTSSAFQVLQTCQGTCTTTDTSGTNGTTSSVNAGDTGNFFQIFTTFGKGEALNCDSAVTVPGFPVDPLFVETQTITGTVSGTVTMVFPKAVVNSLTNNGTPLMAVCAGASQAFLAKVAYPGSTDFPYQGLLYDCTDAAYLASAASYPVQLCVQSRAKVGNGAEKIVVFTSDLSDPSYW